MAIDGPGNQPGGHMAKTEPVERREALPDSERSAQSKGATGQDSEAHRTHDSTERPGESGTT